ncbi:MAG: TolC family protein [Synergistes sp.]|nr:TolC family protein [Synergistes sp.]
MSRSAIGVFISAAVITLSSAASCFGATLTIEECLSAAIMNNPDVKSAAETITAQKATIQQAASTARPQISASAGYTRAGSGLSSENHNGSFTERVALTESISDWGRRESKVKGAILSTEAASYDLFSVRQALIKDVWTAYYGINKAVRDEEIAKTRLNNYKKRLAWAKSYYNAGTKAKIEVTKAEADLAASKLAIVKAQADKEDCKAELANLMGEPLRDIDGVVDMLDFKEFEVTVDEAIERAMQNRPEIAAKAKRVEYAKTNLTLQKKGLSPSLSATAGYGSGGVSFFDNGGDWNAGLSLTLPISDGGLTKSRTQEAEAKLKVAEFEMQSLKNSVSLEIRQYWQALREAKEAYLSSLEAERSAKATLDLAEGRYAAGVGSSLEISDAVESYASASTNKVLSLHICKTAQLNLEKAMGGLDYGN